MYVFTILDDSYDTGQGPRFFQQLLNNESAWLMFSWGLLEQATGYIIIYILPILLALKSRYAREMTIMGGTILGVVTAMTFLVQQVCFSLFTELRIRPGDDA